MISQKQSNDLWSHIEEFKTAMLISHDGQDLRARPMGVVQDSFDGTLFFFTKRDAHKVDEVKNEREVCVTFSDEDDSSYVSCSGLGRVIRDQELIDRFWNPFVAAWFPEGKDDENVALLEVHVHKAELWDNDQSAMRNLYEIAKANLTDEMPDMGRNKKYG